MTQILRPCKLKRVVGHKGITTGGIGYVVVHVWKHNGDIDVRYDGDSDIYACDRFGVYYGERRDRDLL